MAILAVTIVVLVAILSQSDGDDAGIGAASLGLKVATLDGDAVTGVRGAENDPEARRVNYLLGAIAPRCAVSSERLANMAVAAKQELLNRYGRERKARTILEDLNATTSGGAALDCVVILTNYVITVGSSR